MKNRQKHATTGELCYAALTMSGPPPALSLLRASIDELDTELLDIVKRRRALVAEIFEKKTELGLPLIDKAREDELLATRRTFAEERGIPPALAKSLFGALLDDSHTAARAVMAKSHLAVHPLCEDDERMSHEQATPANLWIYIVYLLREDMLQTGPTQAEMGTLGRHGAFIEDLVGKGVMIFVGRTNTTGPETIGLGVFKADDEAAAKAIVEADPAISEGLMRYALHPFLMTAGPKVG